MEVIMNGSNPITIKGESWIAFLTTLRTVGEECDAPMKTKGLALYENPDNQAILKATIPDLLLVSAAEKAHTFVRDYLVKYETAKRTNNPELASHFLAKWVAESEGVLQRELGDLQDIDKQLQQIRESMVWPKFQKPAEFEKEVKESKRNLLLSELVCMQIPLGKCVPLHAVALFPRLASRLSSVEEYVVKKHADKVTELAYSDDFRVNLTDELVAAQLRAFPNVEKANFSDAVLLTGDAFVKGHSKLKEVNLNNTSIQPTVHLPKKLYPELITIHQDKPKITFDLSKEYSLSWEKLLPKLEEASNLKISNIAFDHLYKRFEGSFQKESVLVMMAINKHLVESSQAGRYKDNYGFFYKLPTAILSKWKSWNADNLEHREMGILLTQILACTEGSNEIDSALLWQLTQSRRVGNYSELAFSPFSSTEMTKTRFLLKELEGKGRKDLLYNAFGYISEATSQLIKLTSTADQEQIRYLQEIYIILSHYINVNDRSFYNELEPAKYPNLDFLVACGCLFRQDYKDKFFENLYRQFYDYRQTQPYFPLSKLFLGGMKESELPGYLKNSLLYPLFLNYQGMLHEKIEDTIKVKLFKELVQGTRGGITQSLVEALESLYNGPEEIGIWRIRALQVLTAYAGYEWIGPKDLVYEFPNNITVVSEDARKAIARLKDKIPSGMFRERILNVAPPTIPSSAIPQKNLSEAVD